MAGKDESPGIEVVQYNFKEIYGADDLGNPVFNLITDTQKERAREIIELYSHYMGVKFVETQEDGLTIATGDTRFAAPEVIVLDSLQAWDDKFGEALLNTDPFGETLDPNRLSWFEEAMARIGQVLGLAVTPDAPPYNVMGQNAEWEFLPANTTMQLLNAGIPPAQFIRTEHVYPGDHDLLQGQYLHRPESTDIDVYRCRWPSRGSSPRRSSPSDWPIRVCWIPC